MSSLSTFLEETELATLRRLIDRRISSIYGTAFLVERELVVAERMAFHVGAGAVSASSDAWVVLRSDRCETKDCLDWARFQILEAETLGEALRTTGRLFHDASAVVALGQGALRCIRVLSASVEDGDGAIVYDAAIRLEFDDGRVLSIGHAPGVYEGLCLSRGEAVTLGNPPILTERVRLGG